MNQWGGTWDQGYDQNWGQWGDDGSEGGYLRSLGCIDACDCGPRDAPVQNSISDWLNTIPADVPMPTVMRRPPVLLSKRYAAIDSDNDTMCVQITDLIKKKKKKKLKKTKIDRAEDIAGPSGTAASGLAHVASPVSVPCLVPQDNLASYPVLSTIGDPIESSWTCLRATQNYEAHVFKTTGVMLDYTPHRHDPQHVVGHRRMGTLQLWQRCR